MFQFCILLFYLIGGSMKNKNMFKNFKCEYKTIIHYSSSFYLKHLYLYVRYNWYTRPPAGTMLITSFSDISLNP